MSGCSDGSVASDDGSSGEGFAFGAPQADVDAAITSLEPVDIVLAGSTCRSRSRAISPENFRSFDALIDITSSLPESPVMGQLVALAAITEIAWESDDFQSDFDAQGLSVLTPVNPAGAYYAYCIRPAATWPIGTGVRFVSAARPTRALHRP